ncbi:hypothetical protein KW784_01410 [Candidatus Parcubacteria bacterium]|nr:hypothetical protein [Candidatus Parcubacteria bacterium]
MTTGNRQLMTGQKGFTLFLAIVIAAALLLIASSMASLAIRQSYIANAGRESQLAFYAADTAMECALYWDVHNPSGNTAFDTSTGTTVYCNYTPSNPGNHWVVGGALSSTMGTITFLPNPYCATARVVKNGATTLIEAKGYNTCDAANPRRVERAVRATY